jgi:hypothetical protein
MARPKLHPRLRRSIMIPVKWRPEEKQELVRISKRTKTSLSAVVREAVFAWLERRRPTWLGDAA